MSMLRFTTGQLPHLPIQDVDCTITLPDGQLLIGRFHRHRQNPYIGGRALVGWIKSWLPYGQNVQVTVVQIGNGNAIRLELASQAQRADREVSRGLRKVALERDRRKRRVSYERWERDPRLRPVVLSVWDPVCQVVGCDMGSSISVPQTSETDLWTYTTSIMSVLAEVTARSTSRSYA